MRDFVILAIAMAVAVRFATAIIVLFGIYVVWKLLQWLVRTTYSWLRYSAIEREQEAYWKDYQKSQLKRTS